MGPEADSVTGWHVSSVFARVKTANKAHTHVAKIHPWKIYVSTRSHPCAHVVMGPTPSNDAFVWDGVEV